LKRRSKNSTHLSKKPMNGKPMIIEDITTEINDAGIQFVKDRVTEEVLIKDWQINQDKLSGYRDYETSLLKVQALFQKASEMTQKQLEFHISGLVSTALAAIWDDPYEFKVEFVQRRGKTEADLYLIRNGIKMNPLHASGGGVVDVVSLALRMAFWSLTRTTRPLLILDEPFKHLSSDLQGKAADMLKMLSEELNLQILMISHIEKLIETADKTFKITLNNGESTIQ
jgi:ABC-type dipeptide/oligopeptide/nickel transport system ATPase subunit